MRVIRRFARQVAERFEPERIILFGSHAYGTPHADSDVDILVVMPARNQHDQAVRIRRAVDAPFPMDLIVRTPKSLAWRLAGRESFHTEIITRGKVLYEKSDSGLDSQGGERLRGHGLPLLAIAGHRPGTSTLGSPTPDTAPWGRSPDLPVGRVGDQPNERGRLVKPSSALCNSIMKPLCDGGVHRP